MEKKDKTPSSLPQEFSGDTENVGNNEHTNSEFEQNLKYGSSHLQVCENLNLNHTNTNDSIDNINSSRQNTNVTISGIDPIHMFYVNQKRPQLVSNLKYLKNNYYKKDDYIETSSGNKVSRKSILFGSENIQLIGKSIIKEKAILRGDINHLKFGQYVSIGEGCVIKPPVHQIRSNNNLDTTFLPVLINDYVYIGNNCIIQAAFIGSNVYIGDNCIIGQRCIIKNNCKILQDSILPPDSVVPPFSLFGGVPARFLGNLPESAFIYLKSIPINHYHSLIPLPE